MSNEVEKTPKQRLLEILTVNQFMNVDQMTDILIANGFWDGKDISNIIRTAQKAEVRKWVKTLKNEDGRPAFANIEIENEEGETIHVYMQPCLFDVDQYKQVISYHREKAKYHFNEAKNYTKQLFRQFGVQLELPFEVDSE